MADREDHTAVGVSGAVIYHGTRLRLVGVRVAVKQTGPLITSSLQSQAGFTGAAGRL